MPTNKLLQALFPRARRAILRELLSSPGERLHLRELERRTGVNAKGLMRELHALSEAGLLIAERSGNRVYYRANPACPLFAELAAVMAKAGSVAERLRAALAPLAERIELAYIYGSFARGDTEPDSDIDLMIVSDIKLTDMATPLAEAERELGREVNPTLYPPEEYRRRVRDEDGFLAQVHCGPRVVLIGDGDETA
jgi:predicted nucleotidyltransferase